MNFSERLEFLLEKKGVSKVEVALIAGISTQTFYDWKKKNTVPSADTAVKIAQYLETSVEYLITGKEESPLADKVEKLENKIDSIRKIIDG